MQKAEWAEEDPFVSSAFRLGRTPSVALPRSALGEKNAKRAAFSPDAKCSA